MKYFRKNDVIFILVITGIEIALLILYFSLALFTGKSRRRTGVIVFKERIATRRQTDVFHWQTLYTNSPVYEFDTIRTSEGAEAEIHFLDGTKLDLLENTLVKLKGLDDEDFADVRNGSVFVEAANANKKISFAGKVIDLFESAKLSLSNIGGETHIEVREGEASVLDSGKKLILGALQKIAFMEDGTRSEVQTVKRQKVPTKKNRKLVSYEKNTPVVFSFVAEHADDAKVVIARDKKFKKIYKTLAEFTQDAKDANLFSAKENISLEKVYWKVVYENGEESEVQSVSVQQVQKLSQIQPEANARIIANGENQKIKFSWQTIKDASSYNFEIAENENFSNPVFSQTTANSSVQVASLGDGTYYWRVTPNYSGELIDEKESIVRQFRVEKTNTLLPLKINYPINGFRFTVREKTDFSFSWERRKNAGEYELSFYREGESKAAETFFTKENTARFSALNTQLFSDEGNVYWTVSYKTKSGEDAPVSKKMLIKKVKTAFVFKTIFPKDGYSVAESLMQNIRFTWKNDFGGKTNFIVATDKELKNIVYKKITDTASMLGLYLGVGDYFWCVQKLDADNAVAETAEVKQFHVIQNLPAVNFVSPRENTIVPLLNNPRVVVQWDAIGAADYYEVSVFEPKGKRIVFFPYAQTEPFTIPVGRYGEGKYRVSVQAFGLDTMEHTKNIGLKSILTFESKKINVASLLSPLPRTNVPGITAFNDGVRFYWKSHEALENQELVLLQNGKIIRTIPVAAHGNASYLVPQLESGTYSWYVRGSFFGIDASSNERYALIVGAIPPLDAPQFIESEMQKIVNAEFLSKNRALRFSWKPSKSANYYTLSILNAAKKELFRKNIYGGDTHYDFTSLDVLSRGSFFANVKAVSTSQLRGRTTQSKADQFTFVVDLPKIEKPTNEISKEKEYYGY